jgi:hypothetical protein
MNAVFTVNSLNLPSSPHRLQIALEPDLVSLFEAVQVRFARGAGHAQVRFGAGASLQRKMPRMPKVQYGNLAFCMWKTPRMPKVLGSLTFPINNVA